MKLTFAKSPIAIALLAASFAVPAAFAQPATPPAPPVDSTPNAAALPEGPAKLPVANTVEKDPLTNTDMSGKGTTSMQTEDSMAKGGMSKDSTANDTSTASADGKASTWASLDANSDGKISKDEAAGDSALSAKFATYDKNKDGSLSSVEYGKYVAAMKKAQKGHTKT